MILFLALFMTEIILFLLYQIILRTVSPSHFENGEWNKGGDCVRRKPYLRNEVKFEGLDEEFYRVQMEEFLKAKMEGKKRELNLS